MHGNVEMERPSEDQAVYMVACREQNSVLGDFTAQRL
jgi:hypothetical protein